MLLFTLNAIPGALPTASILDHAKQLLRQGSNTANDCCVVYLVSNTVDIEIRMTLGLNFEITEKWRSVPRKSIPTGLSTEE